MADAKHTPGPWVAREGRKDPLLPRHWRIVNADLESQNAWRKDWYTPSLFHGIESEADARLIAAAPDLLAACESAERELSIAAQRDPQAAIALAEVRAAIAVSKGGRHG